jgi:hypothetical protein
VLIGTEEVIVDPVDVAIVVTVRDPVVAPDAAGTAIPPDVTRIVASVTAAERANSRSFMKPPSSSPANLSADHPGRARLTRPSSGTVAVPTEHASNFFGTSVLVIS